MSTGGSINRAANNPLAPRENAPQAAQPQPMQQGAAQPQPLQKQASPGGNGAMQAQGPYQAPFNGIGFNPQTAGGGLPPWMMQQGMPPQAQQQLPQGIFQQLAQAPQQFNPYAAPRMPAAPTPMPTQVPAQQGIAALSPGQQMYVNSRRNQ